MPRKPRFYISEVPVHVVQRGNNRDPIFFDEADYQAYLKWLKEAAEKYGCKIHAYVLMTNHVHLLLTPNDESGVSRLMQYIGRFYVQYVNHTYGRTGTLWEGRYKSSLVDSERYLLTCSRYIELNPVRASMVSHPGDYPWSSYAVNAEGAASSIIEAHELYKALGATVEARQHVYKGLFDLHIGDVELSDIRASWQTGTPLGSNRFHEKIEEILGRKVGQSRRGRPVSSRKGL